MKKNFSLPMSKAEEVIGWIYLPIHIFFMGIILSLINTYVLPHFGFSMDTIQINLVYYGVGFVFLMCSMNKYMRKSFGDLLSHKMRTLTSIVLCYIVYMIALYVVSVILTIFLDSIDNPNNDAINSMVSVSHNSMIVMTVLLAPVVEEVLFRGVAFGTIRKSSRIAAYVISALIFAVYHLWDYMLTGFSWELVLYLLQYIPGGVVLAWCYERSHNIYAPILLHMVINFISISV